MVDVKELRELKELDRILLHLSNLYGWKRLSSNIVCATVSDLYPSINWLPQALLDHNPCILGVPIIRCLRYGDCHLR